MLNILLLGHDGQIGWELARRLPKLGHVHGVSHPEIDYRNVDAVRALIREKAPDLILNAAAYTAVDKAEEDAVTARAVNGVAPGVLAEEARRLGAALLHYSTDFVFDGRKPRPYSETDAPNPLSVYGETKLEGDRAVQAVGGDFLIFRVSWIYGLRGQNFLLTMRRLAAEGGTLRIVDDQAGCPTWCGAVADATMAVLTACLDSSGKICVSDVSDLYNMACSGETSWFGFARAFLPETATLIPVRTAEYPTRAARPAYSVLDCSRLQSAFGISMPSWQDALRRCVTSRTQT